VTSTDPAPDRPDVPPLRRVTATRYVTPLREGGSLPGIVEADDLGTYVCKFRGAGQGLRVLVAEVVVGGLARLLDIPTPELVVVDLRDEIARFEADEEVQDLLRASLGDNLGSDFLPGSFGYDAACEPDPGVAARVLWLDALVVNVDRSWRNPNLLVWHGDLWAIDHGACLYFHHSWSGGATGGDDGPARFAARAYDLGDHVLRAHVAGVPAVDAACRAALDIEALDRVLAAVPDGWLGADPAAERAAYRAHLAARLATDTWVPRGGAA